MFYLARASGRRYLAMTEIRDILETMQEIRVGDLVEVMVNGVKWGTIARVTSVDHTQEYPYGVRHLNGIRESCEREEIRPFSMDRADGDGRR